MSVKFDLYQGINFIISSPKGWFISEKSDKLIAFISPSENNEFSAALVIETENYDGNRVEISNKVQQKRAKELDYKIIKEHEASINKYPALFNYATWLDSTYKHKIHCMDWFIKEDDSMFILSSLINDYSEPKKTDLIIIDMLHSFEILKVSDYKSNKK